MPEGYLPITSALGRGKPRELLVSPAATDGMVQAIVELGFFRTLSSEDLELMSRLSESLGVAVRAANAPRLPIPKRGRSCMGPILSSRS